jgi:hypothetical protein
MKVRALAATLVLLAGAAARGEDEYTLYELLAPESHRFAITYDVTTAVEGARFFFNPIREGSVSTDEKVIERGRGGELKWEVVKGREAKASGLVRPTVSDDSSYIKVYLPAPVPSGGATRLRISKTYLDPKSYYAEGDTIVFDRPLSIRRNAVVLPAGYELVGCAVPAIVSTEPDGRVKVGFVNDRDDSLPVRIVGRRLRSAK